MKKKYCIFLSLYLNSSECDKGLMNSKKHGKHEGMIWVIKLRQKYLSIYISSEGTPF